MLEKQFFANGLASHVSFLSDLLLVGLIMPLGVGGSEDVSPKIYYKV